MKLTALVEVHGVPVNQVLLQKRVIGLLGLLEDVLAALVAVLDLVEALEV